MSSLKDNLEIQSQGFILSIQELLLWLKNWLNNLPNWFRIMLIILIGLATFGVAITRFGVEQFVSIRYKDNSVMAHSSFTSSDKLVVEEVKVISTGENRYASYAVVSNPNLDLSAEDIKYEFILYGQNDELIKTSSGTTYITPNEKKWIVESRVDTLQTVTRAEFSIGEINWQKKLDIPEVELRMAQPFINEQQNPLTLITQGTVVNDSPFALGQIRLVLVLYGSNGKIVSITQRDEFSLKAYERRAYNILWPGISQASVERIELQAYTNVLDPNNLSVQGTNRTLRTDSETKR